MQHSRATRDQIRPVERYLQEQHAMFKSNIRKFGEPLPEQIADFLTSLQDGFIAKLKLVTNAALVESVKTNVKKYLNVVNWDFANNKPFKSRMPPRLAKIVDTLGLMASRLLNPPQPRRIADSAIQRMKSPRSSTASDDTELYIGSLPYAASENEIKDLFSKIGRVISLTVIRDRMTGQSKGFGFITFADASAARACMEGTHYLHGRRIVINHNNRANKTNDREMRGPHLHAPRNPSTPARFAPGGMNNEIDPHSIYVQHIPPSANDSDLAEVFKNFGQVSRAKVVLDPVTKVPKGFGFVTFDSPDDVKKILAEGSAILHGVRIEVKSKRIAKRAPARSPRFTGGASPRLNGQQAPYYPPKSLMPQPPPPTHQSQSRPPPPTYLHNPRQAPGDAGRITSTPHQRERFSPHAQPYSSRRSFPPTLPLKDAPYSGAIGGRSASFVGVPPASRSSVSPQSHQQQISHRRNSSSRAKGAGDESPRTPEAAPEEGAAAASELPSSGTNRSIDQAAPATAGFQRSQPPALAIRSTQQLESLQFRGMTSRRTPPLHYDGLDTPLGVPGESPRGPPPGEAPRANTLQSALQHLMSGERDSEAAQTTTDARPSSSMGKSGPRKHSRSDDDHSTNKRRRTTPPLPFGWIKRKSKRKNGRPYYFHINSKRSQWRRPTSSSPPAEDV